MVRAKASYIFVCRLCSASYRPLTYECCLGEALFTILAGAPHVHLNGLRIASPIRVEGGELDAERCTFAPSLSMHVAEAGSPAFLQSGGTADVRDSVFANHSGGAIVLMGGGNLSLTGSTLRNNTANEGGALRVSHGGHASVTQCRFESNSATARGGAVFVDGGDMRLGNRTL